MRDRGSARKDNTNYAGKTYNSVDSIAEFFKQRATQLGNTGGSFESTRERAEREKADKRKVQRPTSNVQGQIRTGSGSDRVTASDHERGGSPPVRKGSSNEHETRNSKLETPVGSSPIPHSPVPPSSVGSADLVPGSYVRHAKYGRGLVLRREGVGDSLKLTVTFPGYGQKKLIQKYAGLEKA